MEESLENKYKLDVGLPTLIPWNDSIPGFTNIIPGLVPGDLNIVTAISGQGRRILNF